MGAAERFIDTSVLLYLLSSDARRADAAEDQLAKGGVVSVQVLNEFASVASRKLQLGFADIREVLAAVRAACAVTPVTEETHDLGLQIAHRHRISVWDSMVLASARLAGCRVVVTEDLRHGQALAGLRLLNPFR